MPHNLLLCNENFFSEQSFTKQNICDPQPTVTESLLPDSGQPSLRRTILSGCYSRSSRFVQVGWVKKRLGTREVILTANGKEALHYQLDLNEL